MTEQVPATDGSAVRIVQLNRPENENALTRASSLSVTVRPLRAEAAKAAGLINDVADAAQVNEATMPAGAVALSRTFLRGDKDDVVERIDVETMHFKDLQSDTASISPKI